MANFTIMQATGYNEFALLGTLTSLGGVSALPVSKDAGSYVFNLTATLTMEAVGTFDVSETSGEVETLNFYQNGVLVLEASNLALDLQALTIGMNTAFGAFFVLLQETQPTATFGNAGNDVLVSFGSGAIFGRAGNDTFYDLHRLVNKFDGETGSDTVSYALSLRKIGVIVNLADTTLNRGDAEGDTYRSIENIVGSDFGDKITGNTRDNVLDGGLGADKLNGGAGIDTATYARATTGIHLDLAAGANNTGEAAGDTLKNIEIVIGTGLADTLRGNGGDTTFFGGGGDDFIDGGKGHDILWGDSTAFGFDGADTFAFRNASSDEKTIMDFDVFDHIQISRTGFGLRPLFEITAGSTLIIADDAPVATLGNPTFLFEKSSGKLMFDADGAGTGDAVVIATVRFHSQSYIDANDFVIV